MADTKISALTAVSGAARSMLIPVVEDPSGTPVTKKMTIAQLLSLDGGVITSNTPLIDMAQTWNSGGTTFTGLKVNVTDSASGANSLLLDLQVGGVSAFTVTKASRIDALYSVFGGFCYSPVFRAASDIGEITIGASHDVVLKRDAANVLAQRNGTTAQGFRIYNTYTDGSNYERLSINYTTNEARIFSESAGTGVSRNLVFGITATGRWMVAASGGHFLAVADNTYDIGASGATRPRDGFWGRYIYGSEARFPALTLLASNAGAVRGYITANATGVFMFQNAAASDFDRLQLGGTTSSFPAIKRVSAGLKFVVADDSASADIECLSLKTGAPNGGTAAKWKGGVLVTAAVTPDTTRYIELDVAGTLYKVIVST